MNYEQDTQTLSIENLEFQRKNIYLLLSNLIHAQQCGTARQFSSAKF